jgi:hypothetical protein
MLGQQQEILVDGFATRDFPQIFAGALLVALLAIRRIGVGAYVVVPYLLPLDGTRSWA